MAPAKKLSLAEGQRHAYSLIDKWEKDKPINNVASIANCGA